MDEPPRFDIRFSPAGGVSCQGNAEAAVFNSFRLGDHVIAGAFQAALPEPVSDLVDVAVAVYIADRLCKRGANRPSRYLFGWAREISVTVPVQRPEIWESEPVSTLLQKTLGYLTEDRWTFNFERRATAVRSGFQQSLFPVDLGGPVRAALFSGGLDSLAGLCAEIAAGRSDTFVLFAGSTNRYHQGKQRRLIDAVARMTGTSILPCVVPYGFRGRAPRAGNHDEPTQRTRGFIHGVLGAATAVMAHSDRLAIYENGVGCLNLPYSAAQIGPHVTRAANPVSAELLSAFLSSVLGHRFTVELPFIGETKGGICASIHAIGLGELVRETTSCDRFLRQSQNQCGVCTSCVLRRLSLHAAGLRDSDPSAMYAYDIYSANFEATERDVFGFRMMVDQAERLATALRSPDPWSELVRSFPDLFEAVVSLESQGYSLNAAQALLVRLYRHYTAEWDAFPVRPPTHRLYTLAEYGAKNGELIEG